MIAQNVTHRSHSHYLKCDWELVSEWARVTAISYYFGLMKMGKCGIMWEKMRIVSKEGDLAMGMCELCCNTFLFQDRV